VRKHRLLALASILSISVGLAACGDDDDKGDDDTSTTSGAATGEDCTPVEGFTPVTDGTLTVVTSLPGPGFWEGSDDDPSQVNAGFEYQIAHEIRQAFCLDELDVRNESFDAIVAGSVTDYDNALSQVTITDERAQVVDFTTSYFESNQGVLVKKGTEIKDLDDVKAATWGVQTGTTAIDLLEKIDLDNDPSVYQQLPDAYTALEAGQVDAVLIDTAINLGQAARSNGELEVVAQFEQESGPDQYGAILPKGSENLDAVNSVFEDLISSGRIAELAEQELTADPGDIPVITIEG
jgi:polar amino acid transport system substrate-binding protein